MAVRKRTKGLLVVAMGRQYAQRGRKICVDLHGAFKGTGWCYIVTLRIRSRINQVYELVVLQYWYLAGHGTVIPGLKTERDAPETWAWDLQHGYSAALIDWFMSIDVNWYLRSTAMKALLVAHWSPRSALLFIAALQGPTCVFLHLKC